MRPWGQGETQVFLLSPVPVHVQRGHRMHDPGAVQIVSAGDHHIPEFPAPRFMTGTDQARAGGFKDPAADPRPRQQFCIGFIDHQVQTQAHIDRLMRRYPEAKAIDVVMVAQNDAEYAAMKEAFR